MQQPAERITPPYGTDVSDLDDLSDKEIRRFVAQSAATQTDILRQQSFIISGLKRLEDQNKHLLVYAKSVAAETDGKIEGLRGTVLALTSTISDLDSRIESVESATLQNVAAVSDVSADVHDLKDSMAEVKDMIGEPPDLEALTRASITDEAPQALGTGLQGAMYQHSLARAREVNGAAGRGAAYGGGIGVALAVIIEILRIVILGG